MKKLFLLLVIVFAAMFASAQDKPEQPQEQPKEDTLVKTYVQLNVNEIKSNDSLRISNYMKNQKPSRSLIATAASSVADFSLKVIFSEVYNTVNVRKRNRTNWDNMIEKECNYFENISYLNNLSDFYSKGSFDGPLDPANLKFNGFTLYAQNDGKDMLKFYCHVDTEDTGLDFIFNHSKFRLVLDSVYFYPYNCHLPNMMANDIFVNEKNKKIRNTGFSFEEREDLMVDIDFTFTSSWYNEAIMLAKDVPLGTFKVQIPINEEQVVDSVYIYRKGMPGVEPLVIVGDCFLVPRSYMPLSGGVAHWGTGEYNVTALVSEKCTVTSKVSDKWSRDYKKMKRMKRNSKEEETYYVNKYSQEGNVIVKKVVKAFKKDKTKKQK